MDRFDKTSLPRGPGAALLVALLSAFAVSPAAGQLPPDEAWRTLETTHFRVTYPDGFLDLARRAGDRGEVAWGLLAERFVRPPKGKVDLVITDHADVSNGFAKVFPSKRIVIFTPPPVDGFSLSHMDEWMELVVTHELVHIFQGDLALGLGGALRKVFGRIPLEWPFFPGTATPGWAEEGIATYYESSLTEAGRVRGSFHEMVIRSAILEGTFESIDQTSGDSQVWPGGQRYYVYGSLFLNHIKELYGEETVGAFVEEVAGQWVPYRMNAAAKKTFGTSFSEAWDAWEAELRIRYAALTDSLAAWAPLTVGETLTEEGYYAMNPAPSPLGDGVVFARQDGRSDTQLRLLDPETGESRKLTRVNRLANLAWTPEGQVLFSQTEYTDSYRIRGDLYLLGLDGEEGQITHGERLDHPHVLPSGGKAVAVQEEGGTNRLVLVDLPSGALRPLTEAEPLVHWAYPRWSPDGRWIAVARWTAGAHFDLVLLDGEGKVVQEVTRDRAIDTSPAWSPDGRWLLWASDRSGIPNLHAVEIDPETGRPGPRRQVTNVLGGAGYPAVDPTGRWIYFSGYHAGGWHVERIPFEPGSWFSPFPLHPTFLGEVDTGRYEGRAQAPEGGYSPLPTLTPTYWAPRYRPGEKAGSVEVLKPGFGISTSGEDLVGRHGYSLMGTFSGGPGGFEGGASYSFAGLGNPILSVSANQSLDADGPLEAPDESGDLLYVVERERGVGLGATLLRRRSRNILSLTLSGSHIWEHRTLLESDLEESGRFRLNRPDTRLADVRASVSYGTARSFPMSLSPEDGVGIYLRGRFRRDLTRADSLRDLHGQDRSLRDVLGQLTLYKGLPFPGFGNHVLAFRGSGGVAGGPGADQFHFEVGGASGTGEPLGILDLGNGLLFPVRGYDTARRYGIYAWSASAEYRFPIRLVNRGAGLFPLHLDWLSGALFFDAGNAWGPELDLRGYQNPARDPLASLGGEVTARVLPLWFALLDVRLGVGFPLVEGEGTRAYLRLGTSF
jgi:hypothetical protein